MADKKFGVKQINLIGASGTPTLTSPNNLNINATTVAISTDVTVGGELTGNIIGNVKSASLSGLSTFSNLQIGLSTVYSVSDVLGNVAIGTNTTVNEYDIGRSTLVLDGRTYPENPNVVGGGSLQINSNAKKFGEIATLDGVGIGSFFNIDAYVPLSVNNYGTNNYAYVGIAATFGSDVTVGAAYSLTATGGYYGDASRVVSGKWTLGANGTSNYTFDGVGVNAGNNYNTPMYLARGCVYEFVNNSGGSHPFQIRVSNGGAAYSTGVTNNGASSGTIRFEVPMDAPNSLYYQCTSHSGMGGTITVYPDAVV
jgi:hypothetical protein